MNYGHKLRGGLPEGMGECGGGHGGKNWDNCNSIINKIYLKNKIQVALKILPIFYLLKLI